MNASANVLIVGAGPTGLVMAHELARDGVACRLIDKAAARSTHSKAIAIHARTLETFQLMRIVDDFFAVGQPIGAIRLLGENGPIMEEHADGLAEVLAGDRAPDVPLARANSGSSLQLYDLLSDRQPRLLDVGDASRPWPSDPLLRVPADVVQRCGFA
jgi:choline dehydrogenase-like flavoprotein